MSQSKDYYKILGVAKNASDQEIKVAYRKLARKYHPDVSKETNAEAKFKDLQEAYAVLKDSDKRAEYDNPPQQSFNQYQSQRHSTHGFGADNDQFDNPNDFFESLFRGGRSRDFSAAGEDIHSQITISLEDAFNGAVKHIQLPTVDKQGITTTQTLKVNIPAGIKDGQRIRLAAQGHPGYGTGPKGDLYLKINITKHHLYDLINNDVYLTLPIAPWEAALGATVSVPTLSGYVDLKIPANSQGGQKMRIKGRGLKGTHPGDQYIILKIVVPRATTERAKELYKQMADEIPFNPRENLK